MFRKFPPLICNSYFCLSIQFILLILTTIYFIFAFNSFNGNKDTFHEVESTILSSSPPTIQDDIHIATVTCVKKDDTDKYLNVSQLSVVIETITLVKSTLASAIVHKIAPRQLVFHIFVDSEELQSYLQSELYVFQDAMKSHGVTYQIQFHSVYDNVVPSVYQQDFISGAKGDPNRPLPCTFIRLFLHQGLPRSVTKVLYLDTDIIITGNIDKIWNTKMVDDQALALAQNNEARDKNYGYGDIYNFENLPVVPPKGLNAGVILINLEILRETKWTRNLIVAYKEYMKKDVHMNDQRLINVMLYYNIRRLKVLPCHYNFQYIHCQRGLICWDGNTDPEGIQIIHGAGDIFQYDNKALFMVYESYKNFDLAGRHNHIVEELLRPIRTFYLKEISSSSCNGRIGHLLFKNIF